MKSCDVMCLYKPEQYFWEESVRFVAALAFCKKTRTSSTCLCRNACSVAWYLILSAWSRKRRRGKCLTGHKNEDPEKPGMLGTCRFGHCAKCDGCQQFVMLQLCMFVEESESQAGVGCIAWCIAFALNGWIELTLRLWDLSHFAKLGRQNVSDAMSFVTLSACT